MSFKVGEMKSATADEIAAGRAISYGESIRKVGGAHEVDGFLAGIITWEGVEHPVMAIPVARGFLLHIYGWGQIVRREIGA